MLTSIYNRIKHDKRIFEKTIRDSLLRFPNTTYVSGFVDKYEELFRDRSIFGDLLSGEVTGKKDLNCGNPSCEEEANQAGVTQFKNKLSEPEVAGVWTQEVIDIIQYGWVITSTKVSDEERLVFFESHLHHALENKDNLYNLRSFDVDLFLVLEKSHYYLVCFDLKNPSIRVIDNMHETQSLVGLRDDSNYFKKYSPYKVKYIFLIYLHLMGHPKAAEIETSQIEELRISCATTKNFVDCGVFVMRHMEMYISNHTSAWDYGFPKDERAKKTKCSLLRKKYAYKILTCDINRHKDRLKVANDLDNETNEY
ncbi:hypothetical protein R6Q59_009689 [Mikania micrantha]